MAKSKTKAVPAVAPQVVPEVAYVPPRLRPQYDENYNPIDPTPEERAADAKKTEEIRLKLEEMVGCKVKITPSFLEGVPDALRASFECVIDGAKVVHTEEVSLEILLSPEILEFVVAGAVETFRSIREQNWREWHTEE